MSSSDLQDEKKTDVDEIFRRLNRCGRYQLVQTVQIFLGFAPSAFNMMGIIFIFSDVPTQCTPMSNETLANFTLPTNSQIIYKECAIEIHSNESVIKSLPCNEGFYYPNGKHVSIKSQWDLVCGRENLADLVMSAYGIGKLVGAYTLPTFADKYGRKPVYVATHILIAIANIINTFAPSYLFYLVCRGIAGFLDAGMDVTAPIFLAEMFPAENRTLIMILGGIGWCVPIMFLPLAAYFLEPYGWRYLNGLIGLMSIYSFVQIWTLKESFRWLIATGKWKRADALLEKMCRDNKVDIKTIEPLLKYRHKLEKKEENGETLYEEETTMPLQPLKDSEITVQEPEIKQKGTKLPGVVYILVKPVLRNILLICMYQWFVCSLVYHGLYITITELSGNKYLNFFLNTLMEFVAQFASLKLIVRWGRRMSCAIFLSLTGIALIVAVVLKHFSGDNYGIQIGSTIFSLIGMFAISAAFLIIWLYTPEMFPTDVRNVGLATSSTASKIATMIAPFSNTFAKHVPWGPGVIFGSLCLSCNLIIPFLPETAHRQLPQTTSDVEEWRRKSKEKKRNKKLKNRIYKNEEKSKEFL